MDTVLTSTLNMNIGLGDYEKLKKDYSIKETLLPPQGYTQHNEVKASYNNFARIIRRNLF